jgi:hypothetical protein
MMFRRQHRACSAVSTLDECEAGLYTKKDRIPLPPLFLQDVSVMKRLSQEHWRTWARSFHATAVIRRSGHCVDTI